MRTALQQVDQVGLGREAAAGLVVGQLGAAHQRHLRGRRASHHLDAAVEQQVGRGEPHIGAGRGLVDQALLQREAAAQAQVDVAVEEEAGTRPQRQAVEAAARDLRGAHARRADDEAVVERAGRQVGREAAGPVVLRHHDHAARPGQRIDAEGAAVDRRLEHQRQAAAAGARAAGRGAQLAVEEEALVGTDRDRSAVAGHRPRRARGTGGTDAAGRDVEHGARARGIDARARAPDHVGTAGHDAARERVLAAQAAEHDGTAVEHGAVGPALRVERGVGAARDIEHRVFADPHRHRVGGIVVLVVPFVGMGDAPGRGHVVQVARVDDGDRAARRYEAAVDGDLALAGEVDAPARIDADHRPLADHDAAADQRIRHRARDRIGNAAGQRQVGAGALLERALERVLGEQRREVELRGLGQRIAGQRLLRRAAAEAGAGEAVDRHRHVDLGARLHDRPGRAAQVVGREALLEEGLGIGDLEHRHDRRRHRQHGTALQGGAGDDVEVHRQHGAGGIGGGASVDRQRCREGIGRHDVAGRKGILDRHHEVAGRDEAAGRIGRLHARHRIPCVHAVDRRGPAVGANGDRLVEGDVHDGVGRHHRAQPDEVARGHLQLEGQRGAGRQHEVRADREIEGRRLAGREQAAGRQQRAADGDRRRRDDAELAAAGEAVGGDGAAAIDHQAARAEADVAARAAEHAAVRQQRRASRGVDARTRLELQRAIGDQRHRAAVAEGRAPGARGVERRVGPQAARVNHDAALNRQAVEVAEQAGAAHQAHGAAARAQAAVERDVARGGEVHRAARRQREVAADRQVAEGHRLQAAEPRVVEAVAVHPHEVARLGDRARQLLVRRALVVDAHVGDALQARTRPVGLERRVVGLDHQPRRQRRLRLAQLVGIAHRQRSRVGLPRPVVDPRLDVAIEQRVGRGDDQRARVAAHGVAVLHLPLRRDQRVVEGVGHAPARVLVLVAHVHAAVDQVRRRVVRRVEPPVAALEPGVVDGAGLHVERAARQVDVRARRGDGAVAGQVDDAALRRPFADAVALVAQVAADLEQPAGRVPAVAVVHARGRGHAHEAPAVDPEVAIEQLARVAVQRRIAQLVALHVDLDVVALHRHPHAHAARHVELRARTHADRAEGGRRGGGDVLPRAGRRVAGRHGELAAGGQGQRAALEVDRTAADDLDARQVAPVGQRGQVVEVPAGGGGRQGAQLVECRRVLDQRIALGVERGGLAVVLGHDGRDRAFAHAHGALGIVGRGQQMDRAARVDRGGGHGHAVLPQVAARERDVALARQQQAAVDDLARGAVGNELRRDLAAARGGEGVAVGAHALADQEAVARGQQCLALARGDLAGVGDLGAQQHHVAAAVGDRARLGGRDLRAGLHLDLAERVGEGGGRHAGAVQAAARELVVGDPGRSRHQVAHVDLARAREHDAVAVGDHHRAVGLDLPLDLRGPRLRIVDLVQHAPGRLLLELHRRLLADVEGLPVQDRAVGGLPDRDVGAAVRHGLHGRVGVEPAGGQRIGVDFEAAVGQAVGNGRRIVRGRLPCRGLRALLRRDRLRRQVEVADGTLQLRIGLLLLRLRARQARRRHAVGQPARGDGGVLRHVLLRHPARAERALRMRRAEQAAGRQRHRDGPRDRRPPQIVPRPWMVLRLCRLPGRAVASACAHVMFPPAG
jgi:hypothetical protein